MTQTKPEPVFCGDLSCHEALDQLLDLLKRLQGHHLLICPHAPEEEMIVVCSGKMKKVDADDELWALLDYCAVMRQGNITAQVGPSYRLTEVEKMWGRLNDQICSLERNCGRQYTAILIPEDPDIPIMMTVNGAPAMISICNITPIGLIANTISCRQGKSSE